MRLRPLPAVPVDGTVALRDYLYTKGDLRPFEVVTCLVVWLTDARGLRSVSALDIHAHYRREDRPPAAAPVRSVSDALRRAQKARLLADVEVDVPVALTPGALTAGALTAEPPETAARALGHRRAVDASEGSPMTRGIVIARRPDVGPRFTPTALGRLVVDALPDKRAVGSLRGLHAAAALYRSSGRLLG
jgi:hypothetical protein